MLRNRTIISIAVVVGICLLFAVVAPVMAAKATPPVFDKGGIIAKLSTLPTAGTSPVERVILIINLALMFVGGLAVLLLVYAGFLYAFAGGNPSNIAKSRQIIVWTLLGIVIILGSYVMTNFVFGALLSDENTAGTGGSGDTTGCVCRDSQGQSYSFGGVENAQRCQQQCELSGDTYVSWSPPSDSCSAAAGCVLGHLCKTVASEGSCSLDNVCCQELYPQ